MERRFINFDAVPGRGGCWIFCVVAEDRRSALSVEIRKPDRIVPEWSGSNLSMHFTFPVMADDIRDARPGRDDCDFAKPCFGGWTSGLQAKDFVKLMNTSRPGVEGQPEDFWLALIEKHNSIMNSEDIQNALHYSACPTCRGGGIVDDRRPLSDQEKVNP